MNAHYLTKHMYIADTGDYFVFLDARRDEYSALPKEDAAGLASLVQGWPIAVPDGSERADEPATLDIVDGMIDQGALTVIASRGKPVEFLQLEIDSAVSASSGADQRTRLRSLVNYLIAYLRAALSLKLRSLHALFERLRKRKLRVRTSRHYTLEELQDMLAECERMRKVFRLPMLSSLHWSLLLIEYFARNGVYVIWVFGVRMPPFEAYCWLQAGKTAVSESAENLRKYVPIATV